MELIESVCWSLSHVLSIGVGRGSLFFDTTSGGWERVAKKQNAPEGICQEQEKLEGGPQLSQASIKLPKKISQQNHPRTSPKKPLQSTTLAL